MLTLTKERKVQNARRAKKIRMKKSNATRLQTTTLDKLFLLACKAPDLKSLYALRQTREAKHLDKPNYSKFIRLLDRLMESI
jgi:hypothetical protein